MARAVIVVAAALALGVAALFTNPAVHGRCLALLAHSLGTPVPTPQPRDEKWWWERHDVLKKEVEAADAGEGLELIFYGDSITESWRGTDMGCERCNGVPEIFQHYFGSKWRSGVLAIGGDQTAHLLWRIQNGELPKKAPKVVVVLIGTNDLGAGADEGEPGVLKAADGAIMRIVYMVRTIRDTHPETHIVLMGLLPRGGTNPHFPYRQPSVFTQGIEELSWRIKALTNVDGHLHFMDCGDHFFTDRRGRTSIDPKLMPDALHPSAAGYELLAECMYPGIAQLMRYSTQLAANKAVQQA